MASTSEKTIAKNVANLGLLITNYTSMGEAYKPGKEAHSLVSLGKLKTDAENAQKALGDQWVIYRRIVAERAANFKPLDKLVTRCLNIFLASDALPQVKDGAKAMADKVRGVSKSTPPPPPVDGQTPEEKKHSTMQQSFTMIVENFGLFVQMLRAEPSYLPGKDDIKLPALDALQATLAAKSNEVNTAFVDWKNALGDRDSLFFAENTGLVDVALATKKYVQGDFGFDSDEYKAIRGILFNRKR